MEYWRSADEVIDPYQVDTAVSKLLTAMRLPLASVAKIPGIGITVQVVFEYGEGEDAAGLHLSLATIRLLSGVGADIDVDAVRRLV